MTFPIRSYSKRKTKLAITVQKLRTRILHINKTWVQPNLQSDTFIIWEKNNLTKQSTHEKLLLQNRPKKPPKKYFGNIVINQKTKKPKCYINPRNKIKSRLTEILNLKNTQV